MLYINDILDPDFDWDEIEITEEEFDELSTELLIDYLKKHNPKERHKLNTKEYEDPFKGSR